MDTEKQRLSIAAARLYYQSDHSQQEVAARLGVSRPTVSRLLQYAKEKGYVSISIYDPLEDFSELAKRLKLFYRLKEVRVAQSPLNEYGEITKRIAAKAAELLAEIVKDGDIIGVAWGATLHELARRLEGKRVRDVEVVQLKGGVSHSQSNTYAAEIVGLFAAAFNAKAHHLPLPVIFDNPQVKRLVEDDRHIAKIIELGKKSNLAVFTTGTTVDDALLFRLGYFTDAEKRGLQQNGVGDICSRFFDAQGEICNVQINERTIGIELSELRNKEWSVLAAGGEQKLASIRAALQGGYANVLITDQFTARVLLEEV